MRAMMMCRISMRTWIRIRLRFRVSFSGDFPRNFLMKLFAGGGKDLETAAAFAENSSATTSATVTAPLKVAINSPFLNKPIKIGIPSTATSSTKPIVIKGLGNLNTVDGKQIRFIPPKVNTANNRVPPSAGNTSSGKNQSCAMKNSRSVLSNLSLSLFLSLAFLFFLLQLPQLRFSAWEPAAELFFQAIWLRWSSRVSCILSKHQDSSSSRRFPADNFVYFHSGNGRRHRKLFAHDRQQC